jgi:hypothetical protein
MAIQRAARRLRYGAPIVVVSGLPRSGTSMAMRMLEAGGMPLVVDGRRGADEDNPRGYFEDERVKDLGHAADKRWLAAARGKAIKIITYLLDDLPDAYAYDVLFMRRDLREVLASQARMLERRGEASDTSDDKMLENFRRHLAQVEATLQARRVFRVCDLEYAQVVAEPRAAATRVRDFIGRRLDVEAMAAAVDATLYRNRR